MAQLLAFLLLDKIKLQGVQQSNLQILIQNCQGEMKVEEEALAKLKSL